MGNKQLTDRDLHCIARHLQNMHIKRDVECRYCKYAFQCSEKIRDFSGFPFIETAKKVKEITGVNIRMYDTESWHKDILAGSWIEECPELLKQFSNISLEEQGKILNSPDIFRYKDRCSTEKLMKRVTVRETLRMICRNQAPFLKTALKTWQKNLKKLFQL